MNTTKQTAESTEVSPGVGRITPVNMPSETNGLNYDSLARDMAATGTAETDCHHCPLWA